MGRAGNIRLSLLFAILLSLSGCGEHEEKRPQRKETLSKPKAAPKVDRPAFSSDSAYVYIEQQVAFGPRVPNTEAHQKAGDFLENTLKRFGMETSSQRAKAKTFNGVSIDIRNIIGSYLPEKNNRVLLFAHWDTRPFADQDTEDKNKPIDGANDGGSGVGVLLEIARQLQIQQPQIGVDIIFFDAEDYGQPSQSMNYQSGTWCLGSQHWSKHPHVPNYSANFGILLDMVGAENAVFTKEAFSMYYAPQIVDKVWSNAAALGHANHFSQQQTQHVGEDDHVYVNRDAKIPSIDIIQYDPSTGAFAPHWHTHDDNMDIISKSTLQAVGETVMATLIQEAR